MMEISPAIPIITVNSVCGLVQVVVIAKNGRTKKKLSWWTTWVVNRIRVGGILNPVISRTNRRIGSSSNSHTQPASISTAMRPAAFSWRSTSRKLARPDAKPIMAKT
jgi:hypothetical protein